MKKGELRKEKWEKLHLYHVAGVECVAVGEVLAISQNRYKSFFSSSISGNALRKFSGISADVV